VRPPEASRCLFPHRHIGRQRAARGRRAAARSGLSADAQKRGSDALKKRIPKKRIKRTRGAKFASTLKENNFSAASKDTKRTHRKSTAIAVSKASLCPFSDSVRKNCFIDERSVISNF
jgi:hypothetical protein